MIIRNAASCITCGDYVVSRYVHDYVSCTCGAIAVDGGHEYLRRIGNLNNIEEHCEIWDKHDLDLLDAWKDDGGAGLSLSDRIVINTNVIKKRSEKRNKYLREHLSKLQLLYDNKK